MFKNYRGRFAPSPTGPLHLGSLLTAVGSYLQAKHQKGKWLLRIEDLDPPREISGAADNMLRTLEKFGLHWDETVSYQSQRNSYYDEALADLIKKNRLYPCDCSRKKIRNQGALNGKIGLVYPGYCRDKTHLSWQKHITRINVSDTIIQFHDLLQGKLTQQLASDIGDVCLRRADGLFAYHIAVVVDDHLQGISEVVRGYDLWQCTPIQIHLQQCLGYNTPSYVHLPIVVGNDSEKLSKQTGARSIENESPASTLLLILNLLKQGPPAILNQANPHEILNWGIENWNIHACSAQTIPMPELSEQ